MGCQRKVVGPSASATCRDPAKVAALARGRWGRGRKPTGRRGHGALSSPVSRAKTVVWPAQRCSRLTGVTIADRLDRPPPSPATPPRWLAAAARATREDLPASIGGVAPC